MQGPFRPQCLDLGQGSVLALGHVKADTIILEAQFGFAPDTSMPAAAQTTVATAQSLYGNNAANAVRAAFEARGIL